MKNAKNSITRRYTTSFRVSFKGCILSRKSDKDKRPLVITQNGKSAAILLGVSEYDSLIEKIEILEEVKLAEKQISDGFGLTHLNVKKRFSKRIAK